MLYKFHLFTTFAISDTLISDRGSEFISKETARLCEMVGVSQQVTPSLVHHCLGACERTHRTLAERMTPYLDRELWKWQDVLPAIVFAMNSSVNSNLHGVFPL